MKVVPEESMPQFPVELNFLVETLVRAHERSSLGKEDMDFIHQIIRAVEDGGRGVFISLADNGRVKYILLNATRDSSIGLMIDVLKAVKDDMKL